MRKLLSVRSLFVVLAVLVFAVACRQEEGVPPPASPSPAAGQSAAEETAVPPTTSPTAAPAPADMAAVSPENIDWPPQAVANNPLPGAELALDSSFALRFDQPMDQKSVEAAWSMEPALEGSFSWPREDTVVFTPAQDLVRGTSYRVQVAESAQAQTGLTLEAPVSWSAQTPGDLTVTQVSPADGTQDVQAGAAVTAVFSRPVVPLVSAGEQADLPQPLSFDPPVSGSGTWLTTSVYRFVPGAEGFAGATSYTVTVAEDLADFSGAGLAAPFSWTFTTEGPQVVMVDPHHKAGLVPPTRPISITFNMPMNPGVTEAAVGLNPAAPLDFAWEEDGRVLVATPAEQLALDTLYELTVGPGAQSANGQATMGEPATSEFNTVPFPGVKQTYPADGEVTGPWQYGISVDFLGPMDMDTLEDRVQIEPAPESVQYNYNEWSDEFNPSASTFNVYLSFPLEQNTEYTITIPADAADPYGNTLGEPYTWRFTTPGMSPVASFNLPGFISQISTSFPSEVEIIHRNVSTLSVNLYQPDVSLTELQAFYPYQQDGVVLGAPLRTWEIPATAPEDEIGLTTVSLADGDVLPTGAYVITVVAPEVDEDTRYWQNQRSVLIVADTNVVISEMPDEVHAWLTDLESGQPVAGQEVTLYSQTGEELETAVTDDAGLVGFAYSPPDEYQRGALVITGAQGEPGFGAAASTWTGELQPWNMGVNYGYGSAASLFTYLYTDRPIYRPGDTVYFKGIVREPDFGRYNLPEARSLTLMISNFSYSNPESGFEEEMTVEVGADGLFDGEVTIPEDAPLGTYNIFGQGQDIELNRSFTVAEYRKPEFQVTLTPAESEALRGQAVDVTLDATYFFGGSAAGLEVQWNLYEQSYAPDVEGSTYAFGDQAGFNYVDRGPFFGPAGGPLGTQMNNKGGQGTTDENGRLVITLPADLLEDVEEGSRKVTVEAQVIDITDFPVTATAPVIFHAANAYVGVRPAEFSAAAGVETAVELLTVDWDGEPLGNQNVEVVFYERVWESERSTDYGMYMTSWTPVDTEVARVAVATGERGEAEAGFVPERGGSYVAVATVTDNSGRAQMSSTGLWVLDEDFAGWRTDPRARTMQLVPDETELQAGDTARILVQSPFNEATEAWLIIERGNLVEEQVITLPGGGTVIDLPIKPAYAPNVFVTVVTVKPVTRESSSNPYADMRVGITELQVAPDQFDLDVQLTPRETMFAPGDTAVYDVLITRQGQPVSADFSLALVDLAVLTLKDDNAPPILEAFYSPVSYRSQLGSGLLISGEGLEPEVPLAGGGLGGGGGDGIAEAALDRLEEEDETRSEFPDTAYWQASVQTDAAGQATVEIPLPDSLTTWRLSSKAVTTETEVGQGATDVVVSLPLLVRPIVPRFFTVGDLVQLGAVVNNNTAGALETTVSLEVEGVTLNGEAEQVVMVPANGSQRVRWEVAVEDVPFADLTFRVQGGDYRDASKPQLGVGPDNLIPVYRYDARDFAGTAGELDEEGRRVEAILLPENIDPRRGSLDIRLDASLGAAVLDALEVLQDEGYDTQCAAAVTDRLWANAAVDQLVQQLDLDRPDLAETLAAQMPEDIAALQQKQQRGGGWTWCSGQESDPWLSAYALLALTRAEQNGHAVDEAVISRAENYVRRQLQDMEDIGGAAEANRQAFFLYVLTESGARTADDLDELVAEHRGLLDPYAKALLVTAYEVSGANAANQQTLLADLNDSAIVSATGAHWEDAQQDFFNLSSDVRGTAMVIDALARVDPQNSLAVPAVRWLMLARTIQGWPTAHESAWSIYALGNWMAASGELQASYPYQVGVNGVPFVDGAFGPENLLASEAVSVPVDDLLQEETNFVDFQRGAGDGRLYYTMFLNSFISAENLAAANHGLSVQRTYFDAACDPTVETCAPLTEIATGQRVRVELTIIAPNDMLYLIVEDPLPAGAEGIDPGLNINSAADASSVERTDEEFMYGYWGWWYFNRIEYRDEKVVFLSDFLPAGTYQYTYFLEPVIPGTYQVMPATAYQAYFPDVFGRSDGFLLEIAAE